MVVTFPLVEGLKSDRLSPDERARKEQQYANITSRPGFESSLGLVCAFAFLIDAVAPPHRPYSPPVRARLCAVNDDEEQMVRWSRALAHTHTHTYPPSHRCLWRLGASF